MLKAYFSSEDTGPQHSVLMTVLSDAIYTVTAFFLLLSTPQPLRSVDIVCLVASLWRGRPL